MSYKNEFQANNVDLQGLIDKANALPDRENLDAELSTQDNLIGQIMTTLAGKTSAKGGRPFASGLYKPTSEVYTMTISGLSFRPKIVFLVYWGSQTYTTLTPIGNNSSYTYTALYYYDSEVEKFVWIGKSNNGDPVSYRRNGTPYYSTTGKSPQVAILNDDGFTLGQYYNGGFYFTPNGYSTEYYWYAIGAEE